VFNKKISLTFIFIICTITQLKADDWISAVQTDRAAYPPGAGVTFTIDFTEQTDGAELIIRYLHLDQVVASETVTLPVGQSYSWTWQPPADDFTGYLVEIELQQQGEVVDKANIAVDVSSSWRKFPRYGFVSEYSYMSDQEIKSVIAQLNRYHINGVQFYDWHHKHHLPLKGTAENPAASWNDIANRTIYFSTVEKYIHAAHDRGMMTMAYNLLYGSWKDAHLDGVSPSWRIYLDAERQQPFVLNLPDSWASDIYMMDTSNEMWVNYLFTKTKDVFLALLAVIDEFVLALFGREQNSRPFGRKVFALVQQPNDFLTLFGCHGFLSRSMSCGADGRAARAPNIPVPIRPAARYRRNCTWFLPRRSHDPTRADRAAWLRRSGPT
jgi:hypothetical protein